MIASTCMDYLGLRRTSLVIDERKLAEAQHQLHVPQCRSTQEAISAVTAHATTVTVMDVRH